MDVLKFWFNEYPVLLGLAFGLVVLLGLGVLLGILMHRAGMSLRPLVWFFVLMTLVAGPQAVMHVLDVVAFKRQQAGAAGGAATALQPVPWGQVFGPGADPDLVTDPRVPLQALLSEAEAASLSFNAKGESALAARFPTAAQASRAREAYAAFFQFAQAAGSEAVGWTARRYGGAGEWNHVVAAGNELYAWTGPSRESVVARRESALGPLGADGLVAAAPAAGVAPKRAHEARLVTGRLGWQVMLPFAALNLAVVVLWFFWGAGWASRVSPVDAGGTAPLSAMELRQRVQAAYGADSPIRAGIAADGAITLDWQYGDARWLDLMRAHGMKRVQRLVLHPDESDHTVRVREYWSAFDALAGADGLRLQWQEASGIQFFRVEQLRVFGVQLDGQGRPTGAWSHAARLDVQAMKQPALDAVTRAGWRWQPVLLQGPAWLRWLTG